MVGMPTATDVRHLRFRFAHLCDFRVFPIFREIVVNDDRADASCKIDMPLFIQALVAEND